MHEELPSEKDDKEYDTRLVMLLKIICIEKYLDRDEFYFYIVNDTMESQDI